MLASFIPLLINYNIYGHLVVNIMKTNWSPEENLFKK